MQVKWGKRLLWLLSIMMIGHLVVSGDVVFAEGFSVGAEAVSGINSLNNVFYTLIEGVGDILMILGVWRFGIAFTSDHANEISKGVSAMVCGAMLANIKTFMGG